MNRSAKFLASVLITVAASPFAAFGAPDATPANADTVQVAALAALARQERCGGQAAMTGLQRRILEHASKGVDELRRFVSISRSVHQLDMMDTVAWIERVGTATSECKVAGTATR